MRIIILGNNAQQTELLKDAIEGRFGVPCDTAPLALAPRKAAALEHVRRAEAARHAVTHAVDAFNAHH